MLEPMTKLESDNERLKGVLRTVLEMLEVSTSSRGILAEQLKTVCDDALSGLSVDYKDGFIKTSRSAEDKTSNAALRNTK